MVLAPSLKIPALEPVLPSPVAAGVLVPRDPLKPVTTFASQKNRHYLKNLATNIYPGVRIPSFKVVNQADACPTHIASLLPSTGQWRILLFAGDLSLHSQFARIQALGSQLAAPSSFLHLYPANPIEIYTIHSASRAMVDLLDLHEIFHPWDEDTGYDYWKVYADDDSWHEGFADAYGAYEIAREDGCLVVYRPDQHVGLICGVDELSVVERYLKEILIQRSDTQGSR